MLNRKLLWFIDFADDINIEDLIRVPRKLSAYRAFKSNDAFGGIKLPSISELELSLRIQQKYTSTKKLEQKIAMNKSTNNLRLPRDIFMILLLTIITKITFVPRGLT